MIKLLHAVASLTAIAQAGAIAAQAAPSAGTFRAGAAKVDITPASSTLMNGDRIHDPLNVRAIYLTDGTACTVLVGLDQGNALVSVVNDAVARMTQSVGCPAANYVISATHTHSSNVGGLNASSPAKEKAIADAIVRAAEQAKAGAQPARVGFGTTQVNLNVNRDYFDGTMWMQAPNRSAGSDKTLAVVEFLDAKGMPIGVYMNYAMHPINFYLSGQVSADFPGAASNYVEKRFPGTVAVFSQGASGDQNPLLSRPLFKLSGVRTRQDTVTDSIDSLDGWVVSARQLNANAVQTEEMKKPVTKAEMPAYQAAVDQVADIVDAEGALIGESAIDVMRNLTPVTATSGPIRAAQRLVQCPGRDRVDMSARQGVLPPYKDGAPVEIKVGLLRIADTYFATVNGEVYNAISTRLKREAPSSKLMMVSLANGRANSGYIYSDEAGSHLSFQVIGSRLKPGCAEDAIVNTALDLYREVNR